MANVAFKKGPLAALPSTYAEGTFYVTTDERALYLDIDSSTRIRIGDFQEFATLQALQANTNPSTTALYYITDPGVLAKWNGSDYVQINLDTGATSVEVVGSGNAVTAASYDAGTRKLTLTMGATYTTANDVDSAITTAVGNLGDKEPDVPYANVKEYVDEKATAAQVQADYEQNDPDDPSYILNRPFYSSLEEVYSSNFTAVDMGGIYVYEEELTEVLNIPDNGTIIVFDGQSYTPNTFITKNFRYVGNLSLINMEDDTGEPFVFMTDATSPFIGIATETSGQHTISVNVSTVQKQLDVRYLPEEVVKQEKLQEELSGYQKSIQLLSKEVWSDDEVNEISNMVNGNVNPWYEIEAVPIVMIGVQQVTWISRIISGSGSDIILYISLAGYPYNRYQITYKKYSGCNFHNLRFIGGQHLRYVDYGVDIDSTSPKSDYGLKVNDAFSVGWDGDVIAASATVAGSPVLTQADIPPYTTADEGKILKIVDGKAQWVMP